MYAAIITRVHVRPHPNADRLQLGDAAGYQVIVGADTADGALGVLFPEGGALERSFCLANGLYRKHPDTGEALGGYLEETGRVRAVKLRGEVSNALWLPLKALVLWQHTLGVEWFKPFADGETLDTVGGHKLCGKYYTPATLRAMSGPSPKIRRELVDALPKHYDTQQFRSAQIPAGDVYISEKVHGTSGRTGLVEVEQPLGRLARLWNRLAPKRWAAKPAKEWRYISGTRNCTLDPAAPGEKGQAYRQTVHELIEERGLATGEVVYYEIFGFTHTGTPIMATHSVGSLGDPKLEKELRKKYGERIVYSYGCEPDGDIDRRFDVLVYRVTRDGIDLPWIDVERRALELGFDVPAWRHVRAGWTEAALRELVDAETRKPSTYSTAHPREGVCVRVESTLPDGSTRVHNTLKHKGFVFCALEGIARNDQAFVDLEEVA